MNTPPQLKWFCDAPALIAGYFHDVYLRLLLRIDEESSQFNTSFT